MSSNAFAQFYFLDIERERALKAVTNAAQLKEHREAKTALEEIETRISKLDPSKEFPHAR